VDILPKIIRQSGDILKRLLRHLDIECLMFSALAYYLFKSELFDILIADIFLRNNGRRSVISGQSNLFQKNV